MARPPEDGLEESPRRGEGMGGQSAPQDAVHRDSHGKLKAAHIGAGRNLLVCELFIDEWLNAAAATKPQAAPITVWVRRAG